jgi:hypothetical protein
MKASNNGGMAKAMKMASMKASAAYRRGVKSGVS